VATFLQDHGHEVYPQVRAAYVGTLSKVNIIALDTLNLRLGVILWNSVCPTDSIVW